MPFPAMTAATVALPSASARPIFRSVRSVSAHDEPGCGPEPVAESGIRGRGGGGGPPQKAHDHPCRDRRRDTARHAGGRVRGERAERAQQIERRRGLQKDRVGRRGQLRGPDEQGERRRVDDAGRDRAWSPPDSPPQPHQKGHGGDARPDHRHLCGAEGFDLYSGPSRREQHRCREGLQPSCISLRVRHRGL